MNKRPTTTVDRKGDGYVALCPTVDVASQEDFVVESLTLFFNTGGAQRIFLRQQGTSI